MSTTTPFLCPDQTVELQETPHGVGPGKGAGQEEKAALVESGLVYGVEDAPPWYLCVVLGLQHYLTMFPGVLAVPLLLADSLCMAGDDVAKSQLLGTLFVVGGMATMLQVAVGSRLPIVQGGSSAFVASILAIMSLDKWSCPAGLGDTNGAPNVTQSPLANSSAAEAWQTRLRELQGGLMVASVLEILLGFSGVIGFLLRYIGPLSITPTISLIGLSLIPVTANFASKQWGVAVMTMVLMLLFSQYLQRFSLPFPAFNRKRRCHVVWLPIFKLFPVLLAILTSWAVCAVLTVTGAFPTDPARQGYLARTDLRNTVIQTAPWFRFPYPVTGEWGMPTASAATILGLLAAMMVTSIESVGDYYACARISQIPPPPNHAINRGIGMEGLTTLLAAAWGSPVGTTSFSQNIGAIGITKVASRRVVLWSALIMLVSGVVCKFSAVFTTVPDPVVGGVFAVVFGMVSAVGMSSLQFVDLNSSRNLVILGFSLFCGLMVPGWMWDNPGVIRTGSSEVDQILTVLLSTHMFIGGFIGFTLDNTIPGTREERGLLQHDVSSDTPDVALHYGFPCGNDLVKRLTFTRHVPFCPTFSPTLNAKCCRKRKDSAAEMDDPVTAL
ncbi:PREDICTED: solute carrier family 23 member 1-like [Branchiostoma belcheri]|uniref:Solute carrier family 23 member 1-like n=1 Tax=Branchiostoma belcheri TaxID=7741 RepID=A0A6P5AB02_BRABE|nr:PREDICTED: solute carrier family 23 member 1-like [Branchiostoma belcheri]